MPQKPVFKAVANEQVHNRNVQKYKYNYSYHISGIISASQTRAILVTIEQDADFLIEKITGSAYGPVTAAGIPSAANTDFPQPGIAVGAGFAGRGMTVQIVDTGAGRDLTSGFVPVETILSPGYGQQMYLPYPIKYFVRRNTKLKFDFRNRDTQAAHQIDIVLNGYKYQMPEIKQTLEVNEQVGNEAAVAA